MVVIASVQEAARRWLSGLPPPATEPVRCPVLDWAASGAMALTGFAAGPPSASPAGMMPVLHGVVEALAAATEAAGQRVEADPAVLLSGRAGVLGLSRRGRTSAGGSCRLLPTADGWCAVNLARESDVDSVAAIVGGNVTGDPWERLAAASRAGEDVVARAQLLGVPAAVLASIPDCPMWTIDGIAPSVQGRGLTGAVVVDLSSMWAGPLCAQLLGLAGARVIKVESTRRPDGARSGPAAFFDWLHAGHESVAIDFTTATGRDQLARLVDMADIVIEASRPRALDQLGVGVTQREQPAGRVWVSITGYGRAADRVAFGDDAAVAGGLVGWAEDGPVFCADAVADPLTGLCAALAATAATLAGGGQLIDISMAAVAGAFATAPCDAEVHEDVVCCPEHGTVPVASPRPLPDRGRAAPMGAHNLTSGA